MSQALSSMRILLVFLCASALLAGCGGDGIATSQEPASVSHTSDGPEAFSLIIDSPEAYFQHQCLDPSMQAVIPVNLNNDEYQDFIVHYWCDLEDWGEEVWTPTPDALVSHVSNGDGTYRTANQEVFGESLVALGGASRKYARGDINGDGIDDFVFAMNQEDGRLGIPAEMNATQPGLLISDGIGKYRVERIGVPDWGHSAGIVSNQDGTRQVVFSGYVEGTQAFEWSEQGFVDVSEQYPDSGAWANAFTAIDRDGVTEYIAASYTEFDEQGGARHGIRLYVRDHGVWAPTSQYLIGKQFDVDWITWSYGTEKIAVIEVAGRQYFRGSYFTMCDVEHPNRDGNSLIAAQLNTARLVSGETIEAGNVYREDETDPVNFLMFFEYQADQLVLIDSPILNEVTNANYNELSCKDVTNNGLTDIVVSPFTRPWLDDRIEAAGKPIIYANSGSGTFEKLDTSAVPGHSSKGFTQGFLSDVNGDGVQDFVLFGAKVSYGQGTIEIRLMPHGVE